MVLLAPVGSGKSWALVHLGKRAAMHGKKVLHITLEMAAAELQKRYFQNLLALPDREDRIAAEVTRLILANDRLTGFDRDSLRARFSLQDPALAAKLNRALGNRSLNKVVIKQYPTRTLTMALLRSLLDQLESQGFVPDLLLLDYVGLMKTGVENHRLELGQLVEDLRGLAVERDLAVVTAQQVNREAQNAKVINRAHIAEDFSMVMTADFVLVLNRTEKEKHHKLARLVVDKARTTPDAFGVILTQNYDHGQFVINSAWLAHEHYLQLLEQLPERAAQHGQVRDQRHPLAADVGRYSPPQRGVR